MHIPTQRKGNQLWNKEKVEKGFLLALLNRFIPTQTQQCNYLKNK